MKTTTIVIQGRKTSESDIQFVRQLIEQNPTWHRKKLSLELCRLWNWKGSNEQYKDMACRSFMLKLHKMGHITLPPPVRPPVSRKKSFIPSDHSKSPIICPLHDILPVRIVQVNPRTPSDDLFRTFLFLYHYLDYRGPVGKNIKYFVFDCFDRPLACFLFGAAAWEIADRDKHIGWKKEVRKLNLELVANNSRFLILPWVQIPNLASYLLGRIIKRINDDWIKKYNHPIYLLETFVEKDRFKATCYKAGNWKYVGLTKGRTRNGKYKEGAAIKEIYIFPLYKNFRDLLSRPQSFLGNYQ